MEILRAFERNAILHDLQSLINSKTSRPALHYKNRDEYSEKHLLGKTYTDNKNILETKSKRGWEDFKAMWRRKSPKRAWEIINTLWRKPEIRTKYEDFLNNGKRSKEEIENVPAQVDNMDPTWLVEEIDDDINLEHPDENRDASDRFMFMKRGWENINKMFLRSVNSPRLKAKRHLSEDFQNTGTITNSKRGWEDLLWKRSGMHTQSKNIHFSRKYLNNIDLSYLLVPSKMVTNNKHNSGSEQSINTRSQLDISDVELNTENNDDDNGKIDESLGLEDRNIDARMSYDILCRIFQGINSC